MRCLSHGTSLFRQTWGLLLAPAESSVPSKTNQFDESVLVDVEELPSLGRCRERRISRLRPSDSLLGFARAKFLSHLQRGLSETDK